MSSVKRREYRFEGETIFVLVEQNGKLFTATFEDPKYPWTSTRTTPYTAIHDIWGDLKKNYKTRILS